MLRSQIIEGKRRASPLFRRCGVPLAEAEIESMEVGDFGLNNWPDEGAQIVTLVGTDRVGLKLICLLPGQVLPEHWHTADGGELGKEETLRVLSGELLLYLPGGALGDERVPDGKAAYYRCRDERPMRAPDQITLIPDTPHWMRGGEGGCVLVSISSAATCARDPFSDPGVTRFPKIIEDMEGTQP